MASELTRPFICVLITSRKLAGHKTDLDGTLVIDTVVFSQRCLAEV